VFGTARWRLTLWFTLALGLILVVLATAVFLSTRTVLFDQVNDDLVSRAGRERPQLLPRLGRVNDRPADIVIGPTFTTGGYFYALVSPEGDLVASTPNADPVALAGEDALATALADGDAFDDTESAEGDSLRVYVTRLETSRRGEYLLQVGRSTEPERQALRQLLLVLMGGVGAGLALSLVGGYLLSGRALRPIRAAMDSQRSFIADASHELRTPLTSLRANVELLALGSADGADRAELVADVLQQLDGLTTIVGHLIDLAREDLRDPERAPVALDDVVREEVARMRQNHPQVEFVVALEPSTVLGARDSLARAVGNLLYNAAKWSPDGCIVEVSLREGALKVRDHGAGIDEADLSHVFERFYRGVGARDRPGSGLGLAIVAQVVESHAGEVRAERAPGGGSVLTATLPVAPRADS